MKSDGRYSVIKRSDPVSKRPYIVPLQGLRAFAFAGIFISHVSLNYMSCGACAVSLFFVLSGFLLTVRSMGRDLETHGFSCLAFSWNKIKKLFPLHILMSLPFIWSLLRSDASLPQSALTIAVNY